MCSRSKSWTLTGEVQLIAMGIHKKERWSPRVIESDFVELLLSLRTQRRNKTQPTEAGSHSMVKKENELKAVERKPEISTVNFHTLQDSIFSFNSWKTVCRRRWKFGSQKLWPKGQIPKTLLSPPISPSSNSPNTSQSHIMEKLLPEFTKELLLALHSPASQLHRILCLFCGFIFYEIYWSDIGWPKYHKTSW